ncbi:MAG: hypothetical protein PUD46_03220 [Subdoligranulum sp.]|nr:hypothetical protein [Subdoligranulum sp.]
MPYGNTAQFPPCGLSTAPAAAAPRSPYRHLELCGIALYFFMRKWTVSSLKLSNSQNLIYRACCFP